MAELEKKMLEVPMEATPEGQTGVPAKAETVESKPTMHEAPRPAPERVSEVVPTPAPITPVPVVAPVMMPKDELTREIEEVLSEDLGDMYKNLPPEKKEAFKQEGEKTASLIRQMIDKGKFHGRKALSLIIRWLKMIPGVNQFFLEQESKIKADKLNALAEEQKHKRV